MPYFAFELISKAVILFIFNGGTLSQKLNIAFIKKSSKCVKIWKGGEILCVFLQTFIPKEDLNDKFIFSFAWIWTSSFSEKNLVTTHQLVLIIACRHTQV